MEYLDRIIKYFEEINKVPRPSKHEEKINEFLINFAKEHNLKWEQDKIGNVVIRKDGSKGYENSKIVTIQGHSDMVAEKIKGSKHDFLKDPIKMYKDGDLLKASETTLGADNAIALAMALVILEDDKIEHPPLELLATVDEETEMTGALQLDENILKGSYLLNIDSEEEGFLTMGSAGGELLTVTLEKSFEKSDFKGYEISFSGFLGGHSGMMINEPKGNMIKVMGQFLKEVAKENDVRIIAISSGTKDNSIPREAHLKIALRDEMDFNGIIENLYNENKNIEGKLEISVRNIEDSHFKVIDEKTTHNLINLINELPTGVIAFEKADNSMVETSTNLAVIRDLEDKIEIEVSVRSSIEDKILKIRENVKEIARKNSSTSSNSGFYPGWEYRDDSLLRDVAVTTYKKLFNKDLKTIIIHAGLECGAILKKYKNMDAISIGPDIKDAHTPDESLSLSSTNRVFNHILEILKNLK